MAVIIELSFQKGSYFIWQYKMLSYSFPVSYMYKQIMHDPFPGVSCMCEWAHSRQTVNRFLAGFFWLFPFVWLLLFVLREQKINSRHNQDIASSNLSSRTFYICPYKCTTHMTPHCCFLLSHFVFLHASDCPKCPCVQKLYHHLLACSWHRLTACICSWMRTKILMCTAILNAKMFLKNSSLFHRSKSLHPVQSLDMKF